MMRSPAELLAASAWKHHQAGDLDRAIELYRQAVAIKPDFAEVHNNLGNALRLAGRLDEAVECYRRAIDAKPGFAQAVGQYVFLQRMLCVWREPEDPERLLVRAAQSGERAALAFTYLAIADDPVQQLQ